ncbi:GIN domain-containing protein, partial [Massilia timonae]|uniref:GIN domain-containing protein n=1 Tax=Massilia timonae TaxID=47229 RepID=UPI0028D7DD43
MHLVQKTTLLAVALGAAFLSIEGSQAGTPASAVSEQRSVAAFSAIELSGPYEVAIDTTGRAGLSLRGERRQLDEVETFVRGDTLVVRPKEGKLFSFGVGQRRETVVIHIGAPALKSLSMSGSGDTTLSQVSGERFALDVNGPGDLEVSGAVRDLALTVSGSGDAQLQRLRASNVALTMSGPGDVRLANIDGSLQANISGSGDLEADGLRLARLEARLSGPGDMVLRGASGEVRAEVTGSGSFDACDLAAGRASTSQSGPGDACLGGAIAQLDAEIGGSG